MTHSAETRRRMSESKRGELNPRWKGDGVGFHALHRWLNRNFPKAGVCEECGHEGKTEHAFKRHPEPYTREPDDYRELCRSCHLKFDRGHAGV
jgi:NUMOD3 motif